VSDPATGSETDVERAGGEPPWGRGGGAGEPPSREGAGSEGEEEPLRGGQSRGTTAAGKGEEGEPPGEVDTREWVVRRRWWRPGRGGGGGSRRGM
jgi:hypothetical protein